MNSTPDFSGTPGVIFIGFKIIIQDLILDAITGYLTVINYEKSLEATKKNFDFVSKALEEIKTKFELGSSTLYEFQTAQSSYAIASSNLFAAEQNVDISKKTFKRIVGLNPIDLEDVVDIDSSVNLITIIDTAIVGNLNLQIMLNSKSNDKIINTGEK